MGPMCAVVALTVSCIGQLPGIALPNIHLAAVGPERNGIHQSIAHESTKCRGMAAVGRTPDDKGHAKTAAVREQAMVALLFRGDDRACGDPLRYWRTDASPLAQRRRRVQNRTRGRRASSVHLNNGAFHHMTWPMH